MIDVAIVGGGFSGALLGINLVRNQGLSALILERQAQAGAGLAYSTRSASLLLNVRAANMSAFPDDPGHFQRWAEAECGASGQCFVPRAAYGRYLDGLLRQAMEAAPGQIACTRARVTGLAPAPGGFRLQLADGTALSAARVVLATGNLPAGTPAGIDPAALGALYVGQPWSADFRPPADPEAPVVLIGTGLTAIDILLLLREAGHRGPVVAVSRRGLLPRAHAAGPPPPPLDHPPAPTALAILRHLRARAETLGWRAAIDQLRPATQWLWRRMPPAERARFLRHGRAWWDVHRHRMAPEVAARVEDLQARGTFRLVAGRIAGCRRVGDQAELALRMRDGSEVAIPAARIINCTGPGQLAGTDDPLLKGLLAGGLARADPLGMGLEADHLCRVIAADGTPHDRLFAVGPLTRGCFWEITAVPDIRHQVWALARTLTGDRWVGGEGL